MFAGFPGANIKHGQFEAANSFTAYSPNSKFQRAPQIPDHVAVNPRETSQASSRTSLELRNRFICPSMVQLFRDRAEVSTQGQNPTPPLCSRPILLLYICESIGPVHPQDSSRKQAFQGPPDFQCSRNLPDIHTCKEIGPELRPGLSETPANNLVQST